MLIAEKIFNKKFFIFIIALSLILNLWLAAVKSFNNDELVYYHSSWYVANGYIPYVDFFEHHQPLQWYFFGTFFYLFGDQVWLLYLGRFFAWLCLAGSVLLTYKIGKKIYSNSVGLLGAGILATTLIFLEKIIEFRSDSFQILLQLLSFYFLALFVKDGKNRNLIYSALIYSLAFLVSLKALFILPAFLILIVSHTPKNRINAALKFFAYFLLGSALVILPMFRFNFDYLREYFYYNFVLNQRFLSGPNSYMDITILSYFLPSLIRNLAFWVLGFFAFISGLRSIKNNNYFVIPVIFAALSLISTTPFRHYYLPLIAFMSLMVASYFFETISVKNSNIKKAVIIFLIIFQFIVPFGFLIKRAYAWAVDATRQEQIKKIKFIRDNSSVGDLIFISGVCYNIFRKDLPYVWFSANAFKTASDTPGNKIFNEDIYELIINKRPRIITKNPLTKDQFNKILEYYMPTYFEEFYILKN